MRKVCTRDVCMSNVSVTDVPVQEVCVQDVTAVKSAVYLFRSTRETLDAVRFTIGNSCAVTLIH